MGKQNLFTTSKIKQSLKFLLSLSLIVESFSLQAQASTAESEVENYITWVKSAQLQNRDLYTIYLAARSEFTPEERLKLDSWALVHKNVKIKDYSVQRIKQTNGEPALRITVRTSNGDEKTFESFLDGQMNFNFQMAGNSKVVFSDSDNLKTFNEKAAQVTSTSEEIRLSETPNSVSNEILKKMNKTDYVNYLTDRRELLELSYRVLTAKNEKAKVKTSWLQLFNVLSEVEAQSQPVICYDEYGYSGSLVNGQCIPKQSSIKKLGCKNPDEIECNYFMFGINSDGKAACLSKEKSANKGRTCFDVMPLKSNADYQKFQANLKNLVNDSSLKQVGADGNPVLPGEMIKDQDAYVKQALQQCENENPKSNFCKWLYIKKEIYNGNIVNADAVARSQPKQPVKAPPQSTAKKTVDQPQQVEECSFWCSTKNFFSNTWNTINSDPLYKWTFWGGVALFSIWSVKKIVKAIKHKKSNSNSTTVSTGVSLVDTTGAVQSTAVPVPGVTVDYTGYQQ